MFLLGFLGCLIFTVVVCTLTLKNPLLMIHNYPPKIREKVYKLGLCEREEETIWKRLAKLVFFGFVFGVVLYLHYQVRDFWFIFTKSYILFTIINLYDVIVIDLIWFCHSEGVKIKGTEDMKEYEDMKFHIIGGVKGMVLGLIISLIAGGFASLIQLLFF